MKQVNLLKYNIHPSDTIIVAVSGGIDSMVLLDMLYKHHKNIVVAHCNHGYREESEIEADFVKSACNDLHITFEYKKAINLKDDENSARKFRYDFFNELVNKYNAKLFMAHHNDDQVETILFRFLRGAGLVGLSGMKEYDETRNIIRPFLSYTKHDIIEYANKNNLQWMDDSTNFETKYDRCWLRNEIIPLIKARKAGFASVLTKTSENMAEIADFMKIEADKWLAKQKTYDYTERQKEHNVFMYQKDFCELHVAIQKEVILSLHVKFNGSRQGIRQVDIDNTIKWVKGMKPGSKLEFGKVVLKNYGDFVAYENLFI